VGFHKPITVSVQIHITLKQNPNPNEGVVAANKVPWVMQDPLAAPGKILDVNLFERFPSTSNEFWPETGAIGSVKK
jgi:hypothetical protein